MDRLKKTKKKVADDQENGARNALQEEWFNDYYRSRHKVYRMNFFRGIFFGLGSVIGGTIVVAIIISTVSLFVDIPLIGDFFQKAEDALTQPTE